MYHHGNLKESLLSEGIKYVSIYGDSSLSLRKLASECNVIHAAVYKHFASKEDLLAAMKIHVTDAFAKSLINSVKQNAEKSCEEVLYALAIAYVGCCTRRYRDCDYEKSYLSR